MTTRPAINVSPGTIAMFSDIGCPWASLAVYRLRKRRHELGLDDAVVIDHRAFPLELFNERPTPKTVVEAEIAVIGSYVPELHWQLWDGRDADFPSSTLLPLAAVQAAKGIGADGLRASEQLDAALRHAWWAESRSIHIYTEMLTVAEKCDRVDLAALTARLEAGVGFADVFHDWQLARDADVEGSPHLFLPDGGDEHNPAIELEWTEQQLHGMPIIVKDEPAIYDDLLNRAARAS